MIPFFRKIRRKLANDNKPIRYLRYAIGEIILVVIGILIAIQINNANEKRKIERKIESIFTEIQHDLSVDILKVGELIEYYRKKDSIIYLVTYSKLTYDDYNDDEGTLFNLTNEYEPFEIHDNSYTNLMRNIDNIPIKYKALINQLTNLYTEQKPLIDEYNEQIKLVVLDNIKNESKNKDWFSSLNIGHINDTIIDYYLNDPFYKNEVHYYDMIRGNLHFKRFKRDAVNSYIAITEIANVKETLPAHIGAGVVDREVLKQYVGKYKLKESTFYEISEFLFVTVDSNRIFIDYGREKTELFQQAADTFYPLNYSLTLIFNRDNNGEVIGSTAKVHNEKTERIKVQ